MSIDPEAWTLNVIDDLRADGGVLPQVAGQSPQHGRDVTPADLSRHSQRLEDAIGRRVGERRLEAIDALTEVAAPSEVRLERG